MWNLLYPEFFSYMVKLEKSGADALIMPHISTVLDLNKSVRSTETKCLGCCGTSFRPTSSKVHKDVRWRNIRGKVAIVLFDFLYYVVDYDVDDHNDWIDKAMMSL